MRFLSLLSILDLESLDEESDVEELAERDLDREFSVTEPETDGGVFLFLLWWDLWRDLRRLDLERDLDRDLVEYVDIESSLCWCDRLLVFDLLDFVSIIGFVIISGLVLLVNDDIDNEGDGDKCTLSADCGGCGCGSCCCCCVFSSLSFSLCFLSSLYSWLNF